MASYSSFSLTNSKVLSKHSPDSFLLKMHDDLVSLKYSLAFPNLIVPIVVSNIILETDSPYLSPEPYRGKENEPARLIYIAEKIAQIKNIKVEKVLEITTKTAIRQFDLT